MRAAACGGAMTQQDGRRRRRAAAQPKRCHAEAGGGASDGRGLVEARAEHGANEQGGERDEISLASGAQQGAFRDAHNDCVAWAGGNGIDDRILGFTRVQHARKERSAAAFAAACAALAGRCGNHPGGIAFDAGNAGGGFDHGAVRFSTFGKAGSDAFHRRPGGVADHGRLIFANLAREQMHHAARAIAFHRVYRAFVLLEKQRYMG